MNDNRQHWLNTFKTNIERNRQLQFSKNFALSFVESDEPRVEMFILKDIIDNSDKETSLVFAIDKREPIFSAIAKNPNVAAMIYFPLTKEKYVFQAKAIVIDNSDNELVKRIWNKDLSQDERNNFARSRPNDPKITEPEVYNAQDIGRISANFAALLLTPMAIEHALLKMPEEIADAKNQAFESELRPFKQDKKYRFEKTGADWAMKKVNP